MKAAEERLRAEFGSPRHLLLSFAALTEPVRGGDLGRVRVALLQRCQQRATTSTCLQLVQQARPRWCYRTIKQHTL